MTGLTEQQALERKASGLSNVNPDANRGRTIGQIILSNTITFFNILNLAFFVLILVVGAYKNGLFIFIIFINSGIGIFQEIRAKKMLDSLSLLNASTVSVLRDGKPVKLKVEEIVLGDVIRLKAGSQIPADSRIIEGEIEVNESLLTGEADNIMKKTGAEVLSGSYVTSGSALAEVIHVGKDNYIETISGEAKKFKKVNSELRNSINKILKVISYIIVPLCAGFFAKLFFLQRETLQSAVVQVVTSGIGMIPEGLYLLTTLALTLGVIRLARKKTLVQELYCIETLARVDTLCLDKTGTLTEGRMKVEDVHLLKAGAEKEFESGFINVLRVQQSVNETSEALKDYFGSTSEPWKVRTVIPFSSDRKYSGASFHGEGTYYMGAQQFLCPGDAELHALVEEKAALGLRVMVLVHSMEEKDDFALSGYLEPIGYVTLSDVIRKDCRETLDFFKAQGVALKCISGDDPLTVSRIAETCGLENADRYVDAGTLKTKEEIAKAVQEYVVFGRVKPDQKKTIVECLQEAGHTVAMTGDGVNDVLAMKQANCSIAMASGAEATKHTADVVLLSSDFSAMPTIFNEGRRVINNICCSAAMYLIKTTFSVLLTLFTILLGQAYPFVAVQLSIISACAVGIPTFLLQLEPNFKPIPKHFMGQVFRNAFPAGLTIAIVCFLITNIGLAVSPGVSTQLQTICVLSTGWIYFFMLRRLYSPMSTYRRIVAYGMEVIYYIVMIFGQKILDFNSAVSVTGVLILLGSVTVSPMFIDVFGVLYDKVMNFIAKRKELKKKQKEALDKAA